MGNKYISLAVDYLSKWVNDARVCSQILKSLFASHCGTPRAIINDRGTHFCNDQFAKVMSKYGVTHCLATTYHPQTSGQVEVSNQGLKRILERTVRENRASWSDKLDDALWAFRTAFKTLIGWYSNQSRAYRVYNKRTRVIVETIHVNSDELPLMTSDHVSFDPVPQCPKTALEQDSLSLGPQSQENVPQASEKLETDGEMCMFALTVSQTEPKNIKEAMADSAWIEAMQEKLHQFDRLDVWELVDRPLCKNVINMKWLWKNDM
ncbi:retrovirus-related pol polyprotein from transposon TNT 1-94 [Tanacetum coccineum]